MDKAQSFSFDLSATPISSGGLSFKVTGNATFNPNFNFNAEIRGFKIQTVVFEANNANLSLTAGYELSSSASVSVTNEVSLARLRKTGGCRGQSPAPFHGSPQSDPLRLSFMSLAGGLAGEQG